MIQSSPDRRQFVKVAIACSTSLITLPSLSIPTPVGGGTQSKEPIKLELVKEFVSKAHSDLTRVKELLDQEPNLLNSAWDWGGGDFETGIGGAGHMGRMDIAEYLLSKGARMDVFVAAMLGRLEIVKGTLDAFPDLKSSKGPHGLTLSHHARKGGENAKDVLVYLTEIGAE